jgi:hypothetical protein
MGATCPILKSYIVSIGIGYHILVEPKLHLRQQLRSVEKRTWKSI